MVQKCSVGGGGIIGITQTDRTCVPSLWKPCLHFSTRSPPIHLLILVTLHPSILNAHTRTHTQWNSTFMFHSSAVRLLLLLWSSTSVASVIFFPPLSLSLCHVCCFFLYKKSYSFLFQCVSQSVCLSLSVWPSSWLSGCRWKVGSPSGRPHQADSEGCSPSSCPVWTQQEASCTAAFFLSVFVCLCVINVSSLCLTSCEDEICEVGEVFPCPCSLFFVSCLTTKKKKN